MEKKMTFNYFYGTEADQFSFYRILFAGVVVDTVLDMTRECIIDFILS